MEEEVKPPQESQQFRNKGQVRGALRLSHQEAVASATMTGTNDNFLNAFAIYLQASALQMGWLTATPQLFGAMWQIVSVWLSSRLKRKPLVVATAFMQSLVVALMAVVAIGYGLGLLPNSRVILLILLAVGYHSCINIIQPHWRAWMGDLVPRSSRGRYFGVRSQLTMGSSLLVFMAGGAILTLASASDRTWLGFAILFGVAALGRFISGTFLSRTYDPEPLHAVTTMRLRDSWLHIRESLRDPTFRRYSFFVASMQGAVAISAPFFAVYLLRDLQFTYLQFTINSIASIATQFLMLGFWGRFSDRFGNHLVMVICSLFIPIIPLLWLVSPDPMYLILVQIVSGISWSGFTLSTANYLYDIRPHKTHFALFAAVQSGTSALLVFCGGMFGGYLARHAPEIADGLASYWQPASDLFVVFIVTSICRALIAAWFLPRLTVPAIRPRPQVLQLVFRVARFNAISGVVLDWMSVDSKRRDRH
ncbi:MAG: MFS transporter [Gammaproteobacteria bacterium]